MVYSSEVHGLSKSGEYLAGWQRARAELDNYRKRVLSEQEQDRRRIKKEVISHLLSLSDNFQAMVSHTPAEMIEHSWVQGVQHVARQLEVVLNELGLNMIKGEGETFDPRVHEAVSQVEEEGVTSGQVLEVVQVGYRMGEDVIRPAKVKVAK